MGGIKMKNAHGTWLTCPNICHTFGGDKTQDELLLGSEWEAGNTTSGALLKLLLCIVVFNLAFIFQIIIHIILIITNQ